MKENINTSRRKKTKKIRKINRKIAILLLIIILVYLLLSSPIFCLNKIKISGIRQVDSTEILKMIKIKPRKNIFLIKSKNLQQILMKHPKIKSVTIVKKYPDEIKINITERKPTLLVQDRNIYAIIDKEGQIMEIRKDKGNFNIPIAEGIILLQPLPGKNILNDKIKACNSIIENSYKIYPRTITKFIFESKIVSFITSDNIQVKLGKYRNIDVEYKMDKLQRLFKNITKKIEYVDLQAKENAAIGGMQAE